MRSGTVELDETFRFTWTKPARAAAGSRAAVAPELVLIVLAYGTSPLYGSSLVRKFSIRNRQTSRSQPRATSAPRILP
jgi:hypothetical protein